jgi:alpha-beta hydrolase superfamily lysophospholipase
MITPRFLTAVFCRPVRRQPCLFAAHPMPAKALRFIKSPLLGRYVADWTWPRASDPAAWEQLSIASRNGASLAALYGIAHGCRKGVVVCAHPLRRDAKSFFLRSGRADLLRRNGYDVLLFDFNGFGASSHGDFNYADDVLAVAHYARERAAALPVHALATCFGAVWTLCAATQEHPFDAIVAEAPLTTLHEYYAGEPIAAAFVRLLWRLFPKSAARATPIRAAAKPAGTPRLLLIGRVEDHLAPTDMCRRLYEACSLPHGARAIWYVEGAQHLQAFEVAPLEYEERVVGFLEGFACDAGKVVSQTA